MSVHRKFGDSRQTNYIGPEGTSSLSTLLVQRFKRNKRLTVDTSKPTIYSRIMLRTSKQGSILTRRDLIDPRDDSLSTGTLCSPIH